MTSLSRQILIYENMKHEAEKKCKNIAARLRLRNSENLKALFKQYKELLNMSQHLIDSNKAKLKVNKADDEPIQELKAFLKIMMGYIKTHIKNFGEDKVYKGITYDAVKDKQEFELVLTLVNEGEYLSAARGLRYLDCVAFEDKMNETAMYFHSTNWYRTKYYYYHILLNRT